MTMIRKKDIEDIILDLVPSATKKQLKHIAFAVHTQIGRKRRLPEKRAIRNIMSRFPELEEADACAALCYAQSVCIKVGGMFLLYSQPAKKEIAVMSEKDKKRSTGKEE